MLATLRPIHEIIIGGRHVAEVRERPFAALHERFTTGGHDAGGMAIHGDLLSHQFRVRRLDRIVATFSERRLTVTTSYFDLKKSEG